MVHLGVALLHGPAALDEQLLGNAHLLGDGHNQIVVLESLVDIDDDAVLADEKSLLEGGHAQRVGGHAVGSFEFEGLDLRQGLLVDAASALALPVGATADIGVVAEHQDAVHGHFDIQLHDIGAHADDGLDGRNGVLGIVAPVAAMAGDNDVVGFGIVHFRHDFLSAGGIAGTVGARNDGREEDRQNTHFANSFHMLFK